MIISGSKAVNLSIIIPTYNESANIVNLIDQMERYIPRDVRSEILIVDDNSPDGTGAMIEKYVASKGRYLDKKQISAKNEVKSPKRIEIRAIHRREKNGLIPAILEGVRQSTGRNIMIMDADLSHPPDVIPRIIAELNTNPGSIIVSSRYVDWGRVVGWPIKRRFLSTGASKLARHGLDVRDVKDPMSGFFALPRELIEDISIDTKGYKILLEILVKNKGVPVKEIPYTFTDRMS
jgi:dolichol-phosphate mannosyltransferase